MTERQDPFDRLRIELRHAADRKALQPDLPVARRWRRWTGRPLALVTVGLVSTGIATAAIVTRSTTLGLSARAEPNTPAAHNLGPLLRVLQSSHDTLAGRSISPGEDAVRGTSLTRDGVTVDVAIGARTICLTTRTDRMARPPATCANLPITRDRFPFTSGADSGRAWLAAIVPDGMSRVRVRGDHGKAATAIIINNIALAIVPAAHRATTLSYERPDGATVTQVIAPRLVTGSQPSIRQLHRP